ncbi:MAG: hypothetical protein AAF478_06950 [Pseudomonadota bacterium]
MKKTISFLAATGFIVLAGCSSSSTTYGTGSSHEEDTMKSLVNLLAVSPEDQQKIDYSARPDLVMPANKQALPAPSDSQTGQDANWPVSPEQRIAAVQEAAPEANWRDGSIPLEYQLSEKEGIRKSASGTYRNRRASARQGGGEQLLEEIKSEANGNGASAEARKRREQLAYSTGVKRKFLTEPPSEYRQPSVNAEAGDLGISKEQISAAQKKAKKEQRDIDNGILTPY